MIYSSKYGQIYKGDCLEIIKTLPGNSIDTCITDPPAGIGFMGKDWDHSKGGRSAWVSYFTERFQEVYRILKPGGLMIAWAIPRTAHWTATAIEDAGFEIQTKAYHLFGAGWPKGADISKGIDKHFGCQREKVENPLKNKQTASSGGPTYGRTASEIIKPYPVHPLAKDWDGWNTQLKLMCEEWVIAMKPPDGTYVENALKWGVAGYNIGECRIPVDKENERRRDLEPSTQDPNYETTGSFWNKREHKSYSRSIQNTFQKGRYPGNVIIDEEVARDLDERYGERHSGKKKPTKSKSGWYGKSDKRISPPYDYPDGGASHFFIQCEYFYSGKAPQGEKNMGCDYLDEGNSEKTNVHPTVKNLALMRWLCKLSKTPSGGTVIDPFAGTFSTLIAAYLEGRRFIGIEMNEEYCKIGMARLKHAMGMYFDEK